jgi:hypothetical protein
VNALCHGVFALLAAKADEPAFEKKTHVFKTVGDLKIEAGHALSGGEKKNNADAPRR